MDKEQNPLIREVLPPDGRVPSNSNLSVEDIKKWESMTKGEKILQVYNTLLSAIEEG